MSTSFAARYDDDGAIHDHPECEAKGEDIEITEEGICRGCTDKWWDEEESRIQRDVIGDSRNA